MQGGRVTWKTKNFVLFLERTIYECTNSCLLHRVDVRGWLIMYQAATENTWNNRPSVLSFFLSIKYKIKGWLHHVFTSFSSSLLQRRENNNNTNWLIHTHGSEYEFLVKSAELKHIFHFKWLDKKTVKKRRSEIEMGWGSYKKRRNWKWGGKKDTERNGDFTAESVNWSRHTSAQEC